MGSTATPPAAPSPITATSTGFRLVAMIASIERLPVGRGGSLHTLVFETHRHLRAGITDEIPAGEILVAAIGGIAEHAFEREAPHAVEEAAQVGGLAGVDRGEHGVALFRRKVHEGAALGTARVFIHRGEALHEHGFLLSQIV